jgi:hypothetical protein
MRRSNDLWDDAEERGEYRAACAGSAVTKDEDDDAAAAAAADSASAMPIMLFAAGWAYRSP